jgi:hypothetical protein
MYYILSLIFIGFSLRTVATEDALETHKFTDQKESKTTRIIKPRSNR